MSENIQDQPDFWSASETCEGEGWESVVSDAGHTYRVHKTERGSYHVLDELGNKFISGLPDAFRPNEWDQGLGLTYDLSQPGDEAARRRTPGRGRQEATDKAEK